jgi:hypothetical protein
VYCAGSIGFSQGEDETGDRAVLDDEDESGQAINCLEAYARFQPEHFDRKEINAQLREIAKSAGGAA